MKKARRAIAQRALCCWSPSECAGGRVGMVIFTVSPLRPGNPVNIASTRLGIDDIEPVCLRSRLSAAVEQRRVGSRGTDVEVELAVIFDVGIDPAAVPEGIVPAPAEAAAPAEARTIEGKAEPQPKPP